MTIERWALILMALVIIALILFSLKPKTTDLSPFRAQQALAELEIKELKQSNGALLNRIKSDSAEQVKQRSSFISQINGLRSNLGKQRVKIDTIVLENPEVARYVELADSTIQIQTARIDTLENDLEGLRINARELQKNFEGIIAAQATQLNAEREISSEYKSQVRKARRGSRVWKALAVVLPVGVLLLTQ